MIPSESDEVKSLLKQRLVEGKDDLDFPSWTAKQQFMVNQLSNGRFFLPSTFFRRLNSAFLEAGIR